MRFFFYLLPVTKHFFKNLIAIKLFVWTQTISVVRVHPIVCVHPGSFLDSSSALLAVAACTALGEIGRNGALPIPADGAGFTKLSAMENLLARIPSGKESTKVTSHYTKGSGCCINDASDLQLKDLWLISSLSELSYFVSVHVRGPDEGTINPDLGLPTCGRWRLPSPEEAAAGSHGLCRGMKHTDWL